MQHFLAKGILVASAGIFVAHALAAPLPIQKHQGFIKARKALLRIGWVPVRTHYRLSDGTSENNYGDAALFYDAGINEVQFCSGTGPNYCVHNYRRGSKCLRVATLGEYGVGRGPEVDSWYFECPRELP